MSDRLRIETAHDDDLRWAVLDQDELRFQLCGLLCPDGSMDLIGVTVGDPLPASQWNGASKRLIELALDEAQARQVSTLRCNVLDSEPGLSSDVLREFDFHPAAGLQSWAKDIQDAGQCGAGVSCQPLSDGIRDAGETTIIQLIAETLDGSLDLTALEAPTPEMLLTAWRDFSDCVLLTAQQDSNIVGLAVVTVERDYGMVTLAYIGVAKAFRRLGVGHRLLASAGAYVSDISKAEDTCRLSAWCDASNVPAMEFYRANGFTRDVESTIWQRAISNSSS